MRTPEENDPTAGPRLLALAGRLGDYAGYALRRAVGFARHLHATELAPEHVLASLLRDEECGATRLVLYAFADPATLAIEVMALCEGIMVVRSEGSLPFSVRALDALEGAHREAAARGARSVGPVDLLRAAWRSLPDDVRARLKSLESTAGAEPPPGAGPAITEGRFFATFENATRQALGRAARRAAENERDAISPAHLILGALEVDETLAERTNLSRQAAVFAFTGVDDDPTPLAPGSLEATDGLLELFAPLPDGAGTARLLGRFLEAGSPEVRALLNRQKVTRALLERAGESFLDPPPPSESLERAGI